jgi:histidinol-phosphatase (PHP family)
MNSSNSPRPGWASFHGGHSDYVDGKGAISDIARAAAERGFICFGFTEHFTMPPSRRFNPDGTSTAKFERDDWVGRYVADVHEAQSRHAGEVEILLGTELDYVPGAEAWTRARIARWPFQYFVGSVHHVRYDGVDYCIDWDRARIAEALRLAGSPEQLYLTYYDHVLDLLAWKIARVIGHLDLIKIHLTPGEQEQADTPAVRSKVRTVLETMRDHGVAMDINCRGLIKPCGAIYPADWILAEARALDVSVTLGDDSHAADQVGARLEHGVVALRRAGYSEMALVRPGGGLERVKLPE